ncbi:MAG: hypothetical protein ACREQW_23850 [Candidatus Binatia bacterium]
MVVDASNFLAKSLTVLAMIGSLWLFRAGGADAQIAKVGGELIVETAPVGKLSRLAWRLPGNDGPALLTVTITNLEMEKRVLFLSRVPTQGKFGFNFQFTDGAQHRIIALAEIEGKEPVRQETVVAATAAEPARIAVLPSLFFFLGVIAAGMVTGYASRKKRRLRRRLR